MRMLANKRFLRIRCLGTGDKPSFSSYSQDSFDYALRVAGGRLNEGTFARLPGAVDENSRRVGFSDLVSDVLVNHRS